MTTGSSSRLAARRLMSARSAGCTSLGGPTGNMISSAFATPSGGRGAMTPANCRATGGLSRRAPAAAASLASKGDRGVPGAPAPTIAGWEDARLSCRAGDVGWQRRAAARSARIFRALSRRARRLMPTNVRYSITRVITPAEAWRW